MNASYGISVPNDEIGAAYAFKIHWDGKLPYKLLHARMFLTENPNEVLRMRCRIAAVDSATNLPGESLLNEAVITTFKKDKGWVTCDMNEDQFYLNNRDFYIIFELLPDENATETPMFAISFTSKSEVYDRFQAMGKWRKNLNNLIYSIKVEY